MPGKTTTALIPWAETLPWTCLVEVTGCVSKTHNHNPLANQPCAIAACREPLLADEVCYSMIEMERDADGNEPWVCWRHVRPDGGPVKPDATSCEEATE
jgi:hypothetical protein